MTEDLYERQRRYYHLRAGEYDWGAWEPKTAEHAGEVERVAEAVAALPPAVTLDVACGTGFLSQHLPGRLTLLDSSPDMLALARERVPSAVVVDAEVPPFPFPDGSFNRVFSSHFFDHLRPADRRTFLREARRVGSELILVQQSDATRHQEGVERRVLRDGSSHEIYKVYFTPESLVEELGDGQLLYCGRLLMVARSAMGG